MAGTERAISLIDGNSFYCSCERLFRPDLKDTPIIVLSNNDGAVVSLTPEAKALGFKMGTPYFQIRDELERKGVAVFSSNYVLYGDISDRMMATIETMSDSVSPYSIDEAFADLTGMPEPLEEYGRAIRDKVMRWTGIPVGVGIGPTKTLAKLANWAAKKWRDKTGCVVDLRDTNRQEKLLKVVEVDTIWGVGSRLKVKLNAAGIRTGWDLATHDSAAIRRIGGVVLERTALELRGIPCLSLEDIAPVRQMIAKGQSFGVRIHEVGPLQEAVGSYITRAAEKLRAQGSVCGALRVSIRTGMFNPNERHYSNAMVMQFTRPTDDTRELLAAGRDAVAALYEPGYAYAKAEILLMDLSDRGVKTGDLFAPAPREHSEELMSVMDAINRRMGRGTVRPAVVPGRVKWAMAQNMKSPEYTTNLDELWQIPTG